MDLETDPSESAAEFGNRQVLCAIAFELQAVFVIAFVASAGDIDLIKCKMLFSSVDTDLP